MKGSRVQSVVQELRGERIDIIAWDEDPARFVCNALQPAEIIRVLVNESGKSMEVVVPEEQLLLAIGKRGQNVKLASKLVGWHIEVRAEGQVEDALKRAEGLFAKKPEGVAAEVPPPEGEPSVASPAEGLPAEAPPSVETDVEAKAGPVVEAKEGESSEAPPAEGTEVGAKEETGPAKE
jgi:N utilization substance protein A